MPKERAPIMRVTRLGFTCGECRSPAVFSTMRSIPDPIRPFSRTGLVQRYCNEHLPKDAREFWQRMNGSQAKT